MRQGQAPVGTGVPDGPNPLDKLLARLGSKRARERDVLRRARDLYAKALEETRADLRKTEQSDARARLEEDLAAGRLTEEEYDEAMDALEENEEQRGQYAIEELPDGKKYVRADRQVIYGNDPDSWSEQLEDYINGKIRRGQDVQLIAEDGDVLTLTADTAGKVASPFMGRLLSFG